MSSPAESPGVLPEAVRSQQASVLIVSEDAGLIQAVSETFRPMGVRVTGCLGPAHSRCNLEERHSCPLAEYAAVALVDSPRSGAFTRYSKVVPSGSYAEDLQRAHPQCTVILCGAPEGCAGPTGEVVTAASTRSALALLRALSADRPVMSPSDA